jgi:uroporphyrinogen decarboxylase
MGDPAIISVGHEVDLDVASKYFLNDIIMGNTNTTLMMNGIPQQVYENCRISIEKGRRHRSGFILAPGCELPPLAPPYNVWMMTKAVNDFGWYE